MEELNKQLKSRYIIWLVLTIIGVLLFFMWDGSLLFGFLLGSAITAINMYISYFAFVKTFIRNEASPVAMFVGPMPKIVLGMIGCIVCVKFDTIFSIYGFLFGFCLYILIQYISWISDKIAIDKK